MDFSVVWAYKILLMKGFLVTIELSVLAVVSGTLFGFIVGLVLCGNSRIKKLFQFYVDIFRGSPLLIQLFMVFFGLPYLNIPISLFQASLLVFTLYGGAYIAEIFRSGIESIPKGQFEAAASIGLSYRRIMADVVLPQAMRISLPPLVGFYIGLIKDTSIASIIGYVEIVKEGQSIINITSKPFEIYLTISALYFVVCYPLSRFVARMERRRAV